MNDHIVFRIIGRFADLVVLNILFIISALPLVTAGASGCALYACSCRILRGEPVTAADFLRVFRERLGGAVRCMLILLPPALFLVYEALMLMQIAEAPAWLMPCVLVPGFSLLAAAPWVFIQMNFFRCGVLQRLKNACRLCVLFLPVSVLMAAWEAFPLFILLTRTVDFFRVWPLWLFIYYSVGCLITAMLTFRGLREIAARLE